MRSTPSLATLRNDAQSLRAALRSSEVTRPVRVAGLGDDVDHAMQRVRDAAADACEALERFVEGYDRLARGR